MFIVEWWDVSDSTKNNFFFNFFIKKCIYYYKLFNSATEWVSTDLEKKNLHRKMYIIAEGKVHELGSSCSSQPSPVLNSQQRIHQMMIYINGKSLVKLRIILWVNMSIPAKRAYLLSGIQWFKHQIDIKLQPLLLQWTLDPAWITTPGT